MAKGWQRRRTRIGGSTHGKSYRRNRNYLGYHDAAVAISAGHATAAQKDLVLGLDREVTACRVVVPAGQMLFHGRGDRELDVLAPFPSFVSTPLDPTVSIYHAIKRQQQRTGARTILYALTLGSRCLPCGATTAVPKNGNHCVVPIDLNRLPGACLRQVRHHRGLNPTVIPLGWIERTMPSWALSAAEGSARRR